jgi:hypothetical protein
MTPQWPRLYCHASQARKFYCRLTLTKTTSTLFIGHQNNFSFTVHRINFITVYRTPKQLHSSLSHTKTTLLSHTLHNNVITVYHTSKQLHYSLPHIKTTLLSFIRHQNNFIVAYIHQNNFIPLYRTPKQLYCRLPYIKTTSLQFIAHQNNFTQSHQNSATRSCNYEVSLSAAATLRKSWSCGYHPCFIEFTGINFGSATGYSGSADMSRKYLRFSDDELLLHTSQFVTHQSKTYYEPLTRP